MIEKRIVQLCTRKVSQKKKKKCARKGKVSTTH